MGYLKQDFKITFFGWLFGLVLSMLVSFDFTVHVFIKRVLRSCAFPIGRCSIATQ